MSRPQNDSPHYRLTLRDNGVYAVRWTEDGRTRHKSTGEREHAKAQDKLPAIIAALKKPKRPPSVTVKSACVGYKNDHLGSVASPDSIRHSLDPIIERLGSLKLSELSDAAIRDYAEWRMAQSRKNVNVKRLIREGRPIPTISRGTVIRELNNLRPALAWAYRNGWIEQPIQIKTPVKAPPPRERWITKEEAKRLVDVGCKKRPHVELFVLIALQTAARKSAILQLTWGDIILPKAENGEPVFADGGIKEGGYINFGQGEGNKRRGRTPIGNNPRLFFALAAANLVSKSDYVIEYRGEGCKDIKRGLAAAARDAGVEGVTPHVLKHSSITWLVQAGHPFEWIANTQSL